MFLFLLLYQFLVDHCLLCWVLALFLLVVSLTFQSICFMLGARFFLSHSFSLFESCLATSAAFSTLFLSSFALFRLPFYEFFAFLSDVFTLLFKWKYLVCRCHIFGVLCLTSDSASVCFWKRFLSSCCLCAMGYCVFCCSYFLFVSLP